MITERIIKSKLFTDWHITPRQFLIPLLIIASLMSGYLFMKNPNIGGSALAHQAAVNNLVAGNGWIDYQGSWAGVEPGFGLLSYIFYLFVGDFEYAGMLVSVFAYLAMIPTVYYTVNFLFGRQTAFLAAFLVTFWPTLLSYSYVNLSDCVFAFVLFVSFSLYVKVILGLSGRLQNLFLGLVLGLTYLIRETEGLWIAALVLSSLFVFACMDLRQNNRKLYSFRSVYAAFRAPTTVTLWFLVVFLLYVAFIYLHSGVWSISVDITPGIQIPSDLSNSVIAGQVTSGASNAHFRGQTFAAGGLIKGIFRSNAYVLATLACLWLAYPFLVTDTPPTWPRLNKRNMYLLFSFVIFTSPVLLNAFLTFRGDDNFLLQYAIYFQILLAALTVRLLEKMLPTRRNQHSDGWIALVCLLALLMAFKVGTPDLLQVIKTPHGHLGLRAAGLWLSDHVEHPEDVILAVPRKGEVVSFYASGKTFLIGEYIDVGEMGRREIEALLQNGDVDYLILDDSYTPKNQYLQGLWDNPVKADEFGFTLLRQDDNGLYQIYIGK